MKELWKELSDFIIWPNFHFMITAPLIAFILFGFWVGLIILILGGLLAQVR